MATTTSLNVDVPCPRCQAPLPVPFTVGLLQDGNHLTLQPKLGDDALHAVLTAHFTQHPDCGAGL